MSVHLSPSHPRCSCVAAPGLAACLSREQWNVAANLEKRRRLPLEVKRLVELGLAGRLPLAVASSSSTCMCSPKNCATGIGGLV